jgi:hypothetical protein
MTETDVPCELLEFLDAKLTDLMLGLYRNREALALLEDRAETDATLIATVGMAAAAVRQQQRTLAEIQQRLASLRRHDRARDPSEELPTPARQRSILDSLVTYLLVDRKGVREPRKPREMHRKLRYHSVLSFFKPD